MTEWEGQTYHEIVRAAEAIRHLHATVPRIALILGSGLGSVVDHVESPVAIPYPEIPHFPVSSAPGHVGKLVLGTLAGQPVAVLAGRVHLYEGYSALQVAFPVYALSELGATTLVVTNAAGGINADFRPGTLMLIRDHLNLTGRNPLVGLDEPRLGPRFPDMTYAYDADLSRLAEKSAVAAGLDVAEGVYAGLLGPSFETPAEIRMLRAAGADAVGMSTVMEVIAANHRGMRVLGVSCIANMAAGMEDERITDEAVLETVEQSAADAGRLVREVLAAFGTSRE